MARIVYDCKKALGIKAQPHDTIEKLQKKCKPYKISKFCEITVGFYQKDKYVLYCLQNPEIDGLYECVNRHFPAVPLWFNAITMETNHPAK